MIDIRQIVEKIVAAKDASDKKAFAAHTHALVREYGVNLLAHVAQAIAPTTPEETAVVEWLQKRLIEVAKQIPQP